MAFNFNWSPLTADEGFYSRVRHLLTTALNKSPKPPIIVDDIIVDEFNLGSVPPELEILEIGDLAEDRFRGIFKMRYSGDAFLTLRTRVQANPLNTYLSAKPSFTSPNTLAADASLTIPLQITLSEIKLSAFIILVFSKQKGLTLVFRNDPLESLKVSSTFDSIQFVRDYLQRTIEDKLRVLMMDELPPIIHRLSLQLWCPDQLPKDDVDEQQHAEGTATPSTVSGIDPLATPPLESLGVEGGLGEPGDGDDNSFPLYETSDAQQHLFSQKNLLRQITLTDCQRTLSLFTPSVREALFRAWAGPTERGDSAATSGHQSPLPLGSNPSPPSFARLNSSNSVTNTYTFASETSSAAHGHLPSRPSLVSLSSAMSIGAGGHTTGLSLGSGSRHARSHMGGRKKKTRVVNLRRTRSEAGSSDVATDAASSVDIAESEPLATPSIAEEELEDHAPLEPVDPVLSSPGRVRFRTRADESRQNTVVGAQRQQQQRPPLSTELFRAPEALATGAAAAATATAAASPAMPETAAFASSSSARKPEKVTTTTTILVRGEAEKERELEAELVDEAAASETSSEMRETAWIMKMAGEIARRVYDEKQRSGAFWDERDEAPPPAYEAQ